MGVATLAGGLGSTFGDQRVPLPRAQRWIVTSPIWLCTRCGWRTEEAVTHFATAYELNPELKQAIRISTEISIRRGDYEGADASLSHLEELIPTSFPAYYLRAPSLKSPMETSPWLGKPWIKQLRYPPRLFVKETGASSI